MKAVLFDLDGTLTDSGEGIINCAQYAFAQMGYPVPPREKMGVFIGPPLWDTFEQFGIPKERTEDAVQVFRSRYIPIGKFENTPYPGIREALEELKQSGYKLCVATSKPEEMANRVLRHFNLAGYFDTVCGGTLDESRSSKSEVIAYLLAQNGRADNMVMVGDTKFDVIGAAAHGIPTVGVAWGYGETADMEAAGAKAIAQSPAHLVTLLREM